MKISQTTKDLCLDIARGLSASEHVIPGHVITVKAELERIFNAEAALAYCRVLLSCGLITRVPNLKDVKPENVDIWYRAKNILIRYLAQYPKNGSKSCPVYLTMVKARDSVNLI